MRPPLQLAAVGLVLLLTSCGLQRGPLDYGRTDGGAAAVCAPAIDRPWLIGDSFRSPGHEIHVDAIDLVDPKGIVLLDAWLTTPEGAIGAIEYPPSIDVDWAHAVGAVGEAVPADTVQNFAVAVKSDDEHGGSAEAIAISYSIDGHQYRAVGTLAIRIERACE
ncbi:MAG TPA: hypothetical protein VGO65_09710 [Pseudolysinimonas sp.]|jgi:hypothetical protein|nr:hypothetical protein [Pseudolysinimonas sp.]